jgi:hypothetical protein
MDVKAALLVVVGLGVLGVFVYSTFFGSLIPEDPRLAPRSLDNNDVSDSYKCPVRRGACSINDKVCDKDLGGVSIKYACEYICVRSAWSSGSVCEENSCSGGKCEIS